MSQLSKQRNTNLKVSSGNLWEWLLAVGHVFFSNARWQLAFHTVFWRIRVSSLTYTSIWDNLRIYRIRSSFNGKQCSHVAHQNGSDRKHEAITSLIVSVISFAFSAHQWSLHSAAGEWASLVQGLLKEVRLMNSTCQVSFTQVARLNVKWESWIWYLRKLGLGFNQFRLRSYYHSFFSIRCVENIQKRSQTYWCFPIAVGLCLQKWLAVIPSSSASCLVYLSRVTDFPNALMLILCLPETTGDQTSRWNLWTCTLHLICVT